MLIGAYTFGNIAEKYITGEASFTWDEIKGDLFTVAMTGASMWGSAKDFGTSYCFVAGTLVTTEDGQKPIEEIQVGDRVLSENELTGEVAIKTVTETYVNETDELVHIGVNGETISATPTHPFYVDKLGWTLARSLRAGDVLVLSNGELVTVEFVQHEILESPIKVYNFEVEDFHTYFVGENGIFVHNGCDDFETYYRAMSESDYDQLLSTGSFPGTRETFISPTKGYSANYDGVLVEFHVKNGTTDELAKIGFRDEAKLTRQNYESMPLMKDRPEDAESWILHNSYFKTERGQINIGLGVGDALDLFNNNILDFFRVG